MTLTIFLLSEIALQKELDLFFLEVFPSQMDTDLPI